MALTPEQVTALRQRYGLERSAPKPQQQDVRKRTLSSFAADAWGDVKQVGSGIRDAFANRADKADAAVRAAGDQGLLRSTAQVFGQGAGLVSDAIGGTVIGAAKVALPQGAEDAVREAAEPVIGAVAESAPVQSIMERWETLKVENPALARDIDAALGIGSLALDVAGAGAAKKGAGAVADATARAADVAGDAARAVRSVADAPIIKNTRDAVTLAAEGVARVPGRIATNVAEKAATRDAIKSLGSDVARRAAQNGIEVSDVSRLEKLVPAQKEAARKLVNMTRRFADGTSQSSPIEAVGKPLVRRLKEVDAEAAKIGAKLTEVADNLGVVTKAELMPKVLDELNKVPGLEGLRVTPEGKLSFRNTTLQSAETAADRKAIAEAFSQATRWGKGKNKHLYRQELFEVLDGKKRALTQLTGTQERALQAIRRALSDVLDSKNAQYKALNQQYAKTVRPLSEMRKLLRTPDGVDEDILDMAAGLVARRLSSNAMSNPQVRRVLRELDRVGKKPGRVSVEAMQDIYNILENYYDIAGKTSLRGQVGGAINTSLRDIVSNAVTSVAGTTSAVQRKALDELLDSLLK